MLDTNSSCKREAVMLSIATPETLRKPGLGKLHKLNSILAPFRKKIVIASQLKLLKEIVRAVVILVNLWRVLGGEDLLVQLCPLAWIDTQVKRKISIGYKTITPRGKRLSGSGYYCQEPDTFWRRKCLQAFQSQSVLFKTTQTSQTWPYWPS